MTRIAFDVGATHLRVAEITSEGVANMRRTSTPQDPVQAVEMLADLARELADDIESAYGGIPAVVGADGIALTATNLPAWHDFHFAHELSERLGAPVVVRNDAELAGLGEATYGAGTDAHVVAYLGLGTGVGTCRLVDGVIEPHTSEGERQAQVLALADGSSLEKRIGGHALFVAYGVHAEELPRSVWNELTDLLAQGLLNTIHFWSPDVIVLGGSLMDEENGFRMDELTHALQRLGSEPFPLIRRAALGDASGLYGAKALSEA